ncbi:MAG: hypothetical protein LIO46_04500 [Clostridiales bacterium]|nr:hypothetical protein [Clostridiales bacterium]
MLFTIGAAPAAAAEEIREPENAAAEIGEPENVTEEIGEPEAAAVEIGEPEAAAAAEALEEYFDSLYETEEDFEAMIRRADAAPIVPDKTETGVAPVAGFGSYPTRPGVILVTPNNASISGAPFVGHAAIVYGENVVIESLLAGVVTGKNGWNNESKKSQVYGVTANRTSVSDDVAAANWCYKQLGKPYNFNFTDYNRTDKYYCSQLIYRCFKDCFALRLKPLLSQYVAPMHLVDSSLTSTIYRKS